MPPKIKMAGREAAKWLRAAVQSRIDAGASISPMEKRWSRWAYIAEMFEDHEVELTLDDLYLMKFYDGRMHLE